MHRNNYAHEVGLDVGDKTVPRWFAGTVIVLLAAGAWYGAGILQAKLDRDHEAKRISAAAEAPARPAVAKK